MSFGYFLTKVYDMRFVFGVVKSVFVLLMVLMFFGAGQSFHEKGLKGEVDEIKWELKQIRKQIDKMNRSFEDMENEIKKMRWELESLKREISVLKEDIREIKLLLERR